MLRSEHVIARLSKGAVIPHRLSPSNGRALEVAGELVYLYAGHVGKPKAGLDERISRIEEELGPRLDARRGFKVVRALAKLLEEKTGWASPTDIDPYTLRTRVFELAASHPELPASGESLLQEATREDVIMQVSRETGVENVTRAMYADRRGAMTLAGFDAPTPEALLDRYNVAQVQGVLYGAKGLTMELGSGADARLVFRYVKNLGLIYALKTLDGGAYRLRLDGPLSLFGNTRKYGLRLSRFLPGILLTSPWTLRADLSWRDRDAVLDLDSETCGLTSHHGTFVDTGEGSDVREAFLKAWARAKDTGDWQLGEGPGILSLPPLRSALVPDFTLTNHVTGEEAHLDILGFWSEKRLMERVGLVREAAQRGHRVLVAAPESLGPSAEALGAASGGAVIPFKNRLSMKAVLKALEGSALEDGE